MFAIIYRLPLLPPETVAQQQVPVGTINIGHDEEIMKEIKISKIILGKIIFFQWMQIYFYIISLIL